MRSILAICITLIILVSQAYTASFDCKKTNTDTEKMICADENLSRLDEELSKSYKQALSTESSKEELKKQQLMWIKKVRNTCKDTECLKVRYDERIAALNNSIADAGTSQHTNGMRTSENKAELIQRDVSGKYLRETDNESAELEIRLLHGGKVRVIGTSFYGTKREYGPNIGELDFVSTIKNGHVKYSEKIGKNQYYRLELTFKGKGMSVKEEGISRNFGLNVTFAGEYRKNESTNRK